MDWIEWTVAIHPDAVEAVAALLRETTGLGVAIDQPVVPDREEPTYQPDTTQPLVLRAYASEADATPELRRRISEGLWHLTAYNPGLIGELHSRTVREEDWANAWKEFYHPMRVGRRLVICPTWRETEAGPDDLVIRLDPGMAFGTGQHATTQLCLEALEDLVQPGMTVLDCGTGSGILAIAAARLGAKSVLAIDQSAVAVTAARENVRDNGLETIITVEQGTAQSVADLGRTYDLVVANIIARVICEAAGPLAASLAPTGTLIASGIIAERAGEVHEALTAAGLAVVERRDAGEWVLVRARLAG